MKMFVFVNLIQRKYEVCLLSELAVRFSKIELMGFCILNSDQ